MANEDELLRRLARAEANAYYVTPAGGINIPSMPGSIAGSTADTGIYQSRRPDPNRVFADGTKGYLGGYSNVGSRKIIPAEPPTAPTREQILAEQIGKGKVAADILGALTTKPSGSGGLAEMAAQMQAQGKGGNMAPAGNDNSRAVEQTERMINGLFPQYKKPIVRRPGVLPDIDISSDADQRAFFGSPDSNTGRMPDKVWSKAEIQKKQAAANKDAAARYVGLINGIRDEGIRKAFINDIHPDVRRQVMRLMNTEKKAVEKQQAEVNKQVEKKLKAAENVPTKNTTQDLLKGFSKFADRPIPEKGLMAPVIAGAKVIKGTGNVLGNVLSPVKRALNSDKLDKGFPDIGLWDTIKQGRDEVRSRKMVPTNRIIKNDPQGTDVVGGLSPKPVQNQQQIDLINQIVYKAETVKPGSGEYIKTAQSAIDDLLNRSGAQGVDMSGVESMFNQIIDYLEQGVGPEFAKEFMETYIGRSGMRGGPGLQPPNLMKR